MMTEINQILDSLLQKRDTSAVSFDDAGENQTYSSSVYWEYLNRLNDAIKEHLDPFYFHPRMVIKDNIVQIEIYRFDDWFPKATPFATFDFGHISDVPKNLNIGWKIFGNFICRQSFQSSVVDVEQVHFLFNNLERTIQKFYDPSVDSYDTVEPEESKNGKTAFCPSFKDWMIQLDKKVRNVNNGN